MRSLESNFETAVNADNQLLTDLVELDFSSTYRYTSADIDILYGGNSYLARGLEISPTQYQLSMTIDKASLVLDNVDKSIGTIIEANAIWGKTVIIRLAALTDTGAVSGQEAMFVGVVDSAEYNDHKARFNVYNVLIFWKRKTPRRYYSPSCQVSDFRDTYCMYSGGEEWCDRSWERCVALSNSINFRGWRWLPALVAKTIFWGRSPK